MPAHEINFDGIVGPTHNYAGLSWGNVASMKHKNAISNPRQAALEGLAKMKFLAGLGVKQAVLPPHERPHLPTLRALGFSGSDAEILSAAKKTDATLLAAVSSASAMWSANAATVSPSADSADGKVHFTPANLASTFHRSLESTTTARVLQRIFANELHFAHHAPLPAGLNFADEGAANHTRLCARHDGPGVQIFNYGREGFEAATTTTTKFPARQTLQASRAITRLHELSTIATIFVKQNPRAIDAGAFHNDVVAVGHRNVLLLHAAAWDDSVAAISRIADAFRAVCEESLHVIEIPESELPLDRAVATYLFNSQLVSLPDDSIALIAPVECRDDASVRGTIERIVDAGNPIVAIHCVDVRQSMRNGGGPACLRLRVALTHAELNVAHQGIFLTDALHDSLRTWIERNYRDHLSPDDLADPKLLEESRTALDKLTQILKLGSIYSFQA